MTVEFADRLVSLRRQHGLSQEELAGRLGLSRQAVSKWERGEASPDTDNLLALAELYGVTLDELVRPTASTPDECDTPDEPDDETQDKYEKYEKEWENTAKNREPHTKHGHIDPEEVHVGLHGVHVRDKNGDEVHVDWHGVHVTEGGRNVVHVGRDGVYVDDPDENVHVDLDREGAHALMRDRAYHAFKHAPFSLLTVIAYLLLGFLGGWWHPAWLVFFAIPLYHSAVDGIYHRDARKFAYPVLAAGAFLALGLFGGWWHPGWVVFLTIPLYYGALEAFRHRRRR